MNTKAAILPFLAFSLTFMGLIPSSLGFEYFQEKLYNQRFDCSLTTLLISNNHSSIFVGTNQGIIYSSDDGGESWHETPIGTAAVKSYEDFAGDLDIYLPNEGRRDHAPRVMLPLTWMTTNSIHYQPDIGKVKGKDFSAYNYGIVRRRSSSSDPGNLLSGFLYSQGADTVVVKAIWENEGKLWSNTSAGLFSSNNHGQSWIPDSNSQIKGHSYHNLTAKKGAVSYTIENGMVKKVFGSQVDYINLPPGMATAKLLFIDGKQNLWLLTKNQLYRLVTAQKTKGGNIANVLKDNLTWRLANEPSIGETINAGLERAHLSFDQIANQRRTITLSHFLPYVKVDSNFSNHYMLWQAGGFGKLSQIPHSAPIVWMRKHTLGKQWWNPTKYTHQLDGTVADDDGFGWDITLVATWDFWGIVHDSRATGKTWSRLQEISYRHEQELLDIYQERRLLMEELIYQPSSKEKQLAIILRLEELTTLLNQYTANLFSPFNSLEYMEVSNEY